MCQLMFILSATVLPLLLVATQLSYVTNAFITSNSLQRQHHQHHQQQHQYGSQHRLQRQWTYDTAIMICTAAHFTRASSLCMSTSASVEMGVKKVAIVGAGAGGLALANALRILPTGVEDVKVFDQYPNIKPELGGGVQLNGGAALLAKLGLGDVIQKFGAPLERVISRTTDGTEVLKLDIEKIVREDAAAKEQLIRNDRLMVLMIMRDCLLRLLADNLPKGILQHNKEVTAVVSGGEGTQKVLQFADGTTSEPYDLIVGADGIKSTIRREVVKSESADAGTPAGIRVIFGVGPGGKRPPGSDTTAHQWLGLNQYVLSASYGGLEGKRYDMIAAVFRESTAKDPMDSINFISDTLLVPPALMSESAEDEKEKEGVAIAIAAAAANDDDDDDGDADVDSDNEDWGEVSSTNKMKRRLIDRLEQLKFPLELVDQVEGCTRFFNIGVNFHNPLGAWRSDDGSIVLLGDAAHAMPPFLGQGVNQAVQDAYCLAERLAMVTDGRLMSVDDALKSYVAVRKPAVAFIFAESIFLGLLETAPGLFGAFVRNTFFAFTGAIGVAKKVFVEGAKPKV